MLLVVACCWLSLVAVVAVAVAVVAVAVVAVGDLC